MQACMRTSVRNERRRRIGRCGTKRNGLVVRVAQASPPNVKERIEGRCLELMDELEGINRGIFGVKRSKAETIQEIAKDIERMGRFFPGKPLDQVDGTWKVLYSTISIMGSKRTKLGLRGFLQLSDIYQDIDMKNKVARNRITFRAPGLNGSVGALNLTASFEAITDARVQVELTGATLDPEQLRAIFERNYDMLLEVFNPTGWLEITYVDEKYRIGRDDKDNLFILERC